MKETRWCVIAEEWRICVGQVDIRAGGGGLLHTFYSNKILTFLYKSRDLNISRDGVMTP